jgi:hypothetical protein
MPRDTARMERQETYRILVGTRLLKYPLKRARWRGEKDVEIGLSESGYKNRNWIHLAQNRVQ